MTTVTFDTLKFVETLKAAGVPEAQAKAFSTAVREAQDTAELATKSDIREVKTEIRELELRLEARIEAAKADIVKWLAGLLLAQAGLVAALVKLL